MADMMEYPVPEIHSTLDEFSRVIGHVLDGRQQGEFKELFRNLKQSGILNEIQEIFSKGLSEKKNWATEKFVETLLSVRVPIPLSTVVMSLLSHDKNQTQQLGRAASLLAACATLFRTYKRGETGKKEILATSRIPGKTQDRLRHYPHSHHAVVLYQGYMFQAELFSPEGTQYGGDVLLGQLAAIVNMPKTGAPNVGDFSAMERTQWYETQNLLKENGFGEKIEAMESAIVTLCLDEEAPEKKEDIMEDLRTGKSKSYINRYYDKVVNVVVYSDGTAGLLFEHTVVDGLDAIEVSAALYKIASSVEITGSDGESVKPRLLDFYLSNKELRVPTSIDTDDRRVTTWETEVQPDVLKTLKEERVYDAWMVFSLQMALRKSFKSFDVLLVEPTHVRHFVNGRSDPTYAITDQSRALIEDFLGDADSPKTLELFVSAWERHRELIRLTKKGKAFGPHLAALRNILVKNYSDSQARFISYLLMLQRPDVSITGGEIPMGVEAGLPNAYGEDQLVVLHMNRPGSVVFTVVARGKYVKRFDEILAMFRDSLYSLMPIAFQVSMMSQMKTTQPPLSLYSIQGKNNFSIVLHGGVGEDEDDLLHPRIKDAIKFSMRYALDAGVAILDRGGSALDAVEQTVICLENCFLFNAGKGSIFNMKGEHELEACIIDGKTRLSGSVTGLKAIKNPIKGARIVMESSSHPFLGGQDAEDFCRNNGLEEVPNKFFDTQFRYEQWKQFQNSEGKPKHVQTVGAIALDCHGSLAAATSTGGLTNKAAGRVGDTAVPGSGIFADDQYAVACSGNGDLFLRHVVAHDIVARAKYGNTSLKCACEDALQNLEGEGGVIAMDTSGNVICEFTMALMFFASANSAGDAKVQIASKNDARRKDAVIWEDEKYRVSQGSGSVLLEPKINSRNLDNCKIWKEQILELFLETREIQKNMENDWLRRRVALVIKDYPEKVHVCLVPTSVHGGMNERSFEQVTDLSTRYQLYLCIKDSADAKLKGEAERLRESRLILNNINLGKIEVREWVTPDFVAVLCPMSAELSALMSEETEVEGLFMLPEKQYESLGRAAQEMMENVESTLGVKRCGMIFKRITRSSQTKGALQVLIQILAPVSAPKSWKNPETHYLRAINEPWYRNMFKLQNTLFHASVEYFKNGCGYKYALTPLTTDAISSPMGLGSDSEPVRIDLLGQKTYLADSMQFALEYYIRFQSDLAGVYYISTSFRGEEHDQMHLNQFYHVECELLGDLDRAIAIAEGYVYNVTRAMFREHRSLIMATAGTTSHVEDFLGHYEKSKQLPRITLDEALKILSSEDCYEYIVDGRPDVGKKLTRKGERCLIKRFKGPVWLTEMDHLSLPFYQAYTDSTKKKGKAADLLLGAGETVGLGERHETEEQVRAALKHHQTPCESYKWYMDIRSTQPLVTSGWGLGSERYLCWLLQHDDIRDMALIPRLKGLPSLP